jgi:hypothetical protein
VSVPTIYKILKRHHVPRVSFKRYRPGPRRRRGLAHAGQSVQVDVKHLKLGAGRFYQFTAIDEASRYRVLKIYAQSSIPNANFIVPRVPSLMRPVRTLVAPDLVPESARALLEARWGRSGSAETAGVRQASVAPGRHHGAEAPDTAAGFETKLTPIRNN